MSTKKNVQENALLEVLDEELAQFSGGGILGDLPVVGSITGPLAAPVSGALNATKVQGGLGIETPVANAGLGIATNPGLGIADLL